MLKITAGLRLIDCLERCERSILHFQHKSSLWNITGNTIGQDANNKKQTGKLVTAVFGRAVYNHAEEPSGHQTLLGDWPGHRLAIRDARLLRSLSLLRC